MKRVYISGDNIITSLGFTTEENIGNIHDNRIGLLITDNKELAPVPLYLSQVDSDLLETDFTLFRQRSNHLKLHHDFTRMEKLFILSIGDVISHNKTDLSGEDTLFVLSTTKGNIDLISESLKDKFDPARVYLWKMAEAIREVFGFRNPPMIISNACISGVLAIGAAFRFLRAGLYRHAVVTGGDILSEFVISGFQSFQALSPEPCKPYDLLRTGLSLGEGCGTLFLTTDSSMINGKRISVEGMATSNDANHISGPSRTGEELALAIKNAMKEAQIEPGDIGYISAHGTATPFNDEMESKAFGIAELLDAPVNSFKGYWGHTLGAAGVIESIAAIHSLMEGLLYRSAGFNELGVTVPIHVIKENREQEFRHLLKTASGFGGCNAAIIFSKE